jgi:hypothetical protein
MRRRILLGSLVSLVVAVAAPLRAQSVKGVIVDDSTQIAIEGVLVALIGSDGRELPRSVRSDSGGGFIVHAHRPGAYRVRATRIGFRPVTSDPVSLNIGQVAIVRLRMVTIAQQLIAVRVVERRPMTAAELMSTTGFDLRESKGLGTFISKERLAAMGHDGVRDILATQLQPTLYVRDDPVLGQVLRMRQGRAECAPEIYLDGRLLATAPERMAIIDSTQLLTAMDTLRYRMRVEAEETRVASSQIYALSVLANLRAVDLHGIEVYKNNQILPPSLGAWFGSTRGILRPCGTLAIWTKNGGGRPIVAARSRKVDGLQVISGRVVNYDTNEPVPGVEVTLLNDARDPIGQPVRSDERGEFAIRTTRVGMLRIRAGSIGYTQSTSPAFELSTDELVFVRYFVSSREALLAPLGIRARVLPTTFTITDRGGFTYRRERAGGGVFYRAEEIAASGARSLGELVRRIPGIQVDGAAPADAITFLPAEDLPRCRPVFYIDGHPAAGDIQETVRAIPPSRMFGVEVYAQPADVPPGFTAANENCGLIAIWTKG